MSEQAKAGAGMLAMRAANAAKAQAKAEAWAALTPGQREQAKAAAKERRKAAKPAVVAPLPGEKAREKAKADKRADEHGKASISVAVGWRVSLGWREQAGDVLTVRHVCVEAPSGAVRRAAKLARAVRQTGLADGARFAGVLAVVREDAIALLA